LSKGWYELVELELSGSMTPTIFAGNTIS